MILTGLFAARKLACSLLFHILNINQLTRISARDGVSMRECLYPSGHCESDQ